VQQVLKEQQVLKGIQEVQDHRDPKDRKVLRVRPEIPEQQVHKDLQVLIQVLKVL
jgi:hypothetical protein